LRGLDREPNRLDRGDRELDISSRTPGDQQGSARPSTDIAVAEVLRDFGQSAHLLAGDLPSGSDTPDPVQAFLLSAVHADMGHAVERRARRQRFAGTR